MKTNWISLLIASIASVMVAVSPAFSARLHTGETKLPSGAVIRIDKAVSSIEEYKDRLSKQVGLSLEDLKREREALITSASSQQIQTELEIIDPVDRTPRQICDDYITSYFQFFAGRALVHKEKIRVFIDTGSETTTTCDYTIINKNRIVGDANTDLPMVQIQEISIDDGSYQIAILSETQEVGMDSPLQDVLVVLPTTEFNMHSLTLALSRLASHLYRTAQFVGKIINFIVVAKDKDAFIFPPTYITPSIGVMTIQISADFYILSDRIWFSPGVLSISVWNDGLTSVLSSHFNKTDPLSNEDFSRYVSGPLFADSEKVFEAIGLPKAKIWNVPKVVIYNRTVVSQPPYDIGLPVVFFYKEGVWTMIRTEIGSK